MKLGKRGLYDFYLREAEEDEKVDDGFEAADEDEEGDKDPNAEEDTKEENKEESQEDSSDEEENTEEESEDSDGDEDFDIDADDGYAGEESEGEDSEDPNAEEDDSTGEGEEEEEEMDPIKKMDGDLYSSLSPTEQKMKVKELKRLFSDLFIAFGNVSDKLTSITVSDEDIDKQIKMASTTVYTLQRMVSDYLLKIFDTKSYNENDFMFNRYLNALNAIKELSNDIKKMFSDDSEEG